jgi:hypothetical protein
MAKVIEIYVPQSFKRSDKWTSPAQTGKVVEFRLPEKRSA